MSNPTKEQFQEYVKITDSGISNLFDGKYICDVSKTGLTTEICRHIAKHFTELSEKFSE